MFSWVDPYVFFSTAFSTHSTLLYSLYSTLRFKVCALARGHLLAWTLSFLQMLHLVERVAWTLNLMLIFHQAWVMMMNHHSDYRHLVVAGSSAGPSLTWL